MVAFGDIRYCTKDAWFQVKEAELGNTGKKIAWLKFQTYYFTSNDNKLLYYFQHILHSLGLAADVGALQQLPKVIGSASLARELCLTARKFFSDEAKDCGFVNRVFNDKEE